MIGRTSEVCVASSGPVGVAGAVKRVAIVLVVCVVAAELALQFLPVQSGLRSLPVNDQQPVARFEPNRPFVFSSGWRMVQVNRGRINNAGFVNAEDYDSTATTPLLAVVGSDEVEAITVPFDSTLQARLRRSFDGRVRVYSFAGAGASLSQDLAWVDHARHVYRPSAVVIVLSANDADHAMIKYWRDQGFYHFREGPNDSLVMQRVDYHPSPLRQLVRKSALARYVIMNGHGLVAKEVASVDGSIPDSPGAERLRDDKRAVDAFIARLPQVSGLSPDRIALVVDGMRPALYNASGGDRGVSSFEGQLQRYIVDEARKAGFEVIDMQPIFVEHFGQHRARFEYPIDDDRWNELAHRLAAEALAGSRIVAAVRADAMEAGTAGVRTACVAAGCNGVSQISGAIRR